MFLAFVYFSCQESLKMHRVKMNTLRFYIFIYVSIYKMVVAVGVFFLCFFPLIFILNKRTSWSKWCTRNCAQLVYLITKYKEKKKMKCSKCTLVELELAQCMTSTSNFLSCMKCCWCENMSISSSVEIIILLQK